MALEQHNQTEHLDSPEIPIAERRRLLQELDRSNRWLSVYLQFGSKLKRYLNELRASHSDLHIRPLRVLEVGSGSGGLAKYLIQKNIFGDLKVEYTLFDMDTEILNWAQASLKSQGVEVKIVTADDQHLARLKNNEFDLVISLHVLHHIHPIAVLKDALHQMQRVARLGFFCVDIDRRTSAIFMNRMIAPLIGLDRVLQEDGMRSIRRSYTASEICAIAPMGTQVESLILFPYFIAKLKSHNKGL